MEMQNLNRVPPIQPAAAAERAAETAAVKETAAPARSPKDQYIPGEEPDASGTYWPEADEEGRPGVHFDDPEARKKAKEEAREKAKEQEEKSTTYNTDRIDRKIAQMKEQKEQLRWRMEIEEDPEKVEQMEKTLRLLSAQLSQMDNDGYRRANADIT